MNSILIINGPNLNLLGDREPGIYGTDTLSDIRRQCAKHASGSGMQIEFMQSNSEGKIIDAIQEAKSESHNGIILNAAGYSHTSISIRDAIEAIDLPVVEVHLSNIHAREDFRNKSLIAPVCIGQITGFGAMGYILAMDAIKAHRKENYKQQ